MLTIETKTQDTTRMIELLQFYADWCQPCNMMMPIIESIKQKGTDWLTMKQIDVDRAPELSNQFHIRSIPTFIVRRNDQEIWRYTGMLAEHSFIEILESLRENSY